MDYIEWCDTIMRSMRDALQSGAGSRISGIESEALATTLFGEALVQSSAWHGSTQRNGLLEALRDLSEIGLVESFGGHYFYKGSPHNKLGE